MLSSYLALIDDNALRSEFETFYFENRLKGMRAAYNVLNDKVLAEDALSEAFFKLAKCFQKIHSLPSHKLQAYFVITVKNTALNMLKKETHIETVEYDDELEHDELPEVDYSILKDCITRLGDTDREILYLRFELELNYSEIAAALSISETAARQRVRYAKSKLRKLLEKEGYHG
ncbi:MAG: sigma-70 family RNA polymerase sigma factor [Ruminococcus sp.]|nr:sigma-70 family RNA polymerase sigma factor [Ruminococcus sp.]